MTNSNISGLLNDFTKALGQQLFFWGCDVDHPRGNLLCEFGLERSKSEGRDSTSCYRMDYKEDIIELHGLCVGRYSRDQDSFLYTRQYRRCWIYDESKPPLPGFYDNKLIKTNPKDQVQLACQSFLEWWLEYEKWILENTDPLYREKCFNSFRKLPKSKVWLHPSIGIKWLQEFIDSPENLKRSRDWKNTAY